MKLFKMTFKTIMSKVTLLCILSTPNLVLLGRYPFLVEKAEFYLNPVTIDLPIIFAFKSLRNQTRLMEKMGH